MAVDRDMDIGGDTLRKLAPHRRAVDQEMRRHQHAAPAVILEADAVVGRNNQIADRHTRLDRPGGDADRPHRDGIGMGREIDRDPPHPHHRLQRRALA